MGDNIACAMHNQLASMQVQQAIYLNGQYRAKRVDVA